MEVDPMSKMWIIAYIRPVESQDGPGPYFWQKVAEDEVNYGNIIDLFEEQNYTKDVLHFAMGEITSTGVKFVGTFKFAHTRRCYERIV